MESFMIPCCFHPTRVVVVDDNEEFLKGLYRNLSDEHSSYQYYKNPQKALDYLNDIYQPNPFPNRYIKSIDEEEWEHRLLDINIVDTHHDVYRPERFDEISVIVVDHSMPGISGLRLCQQIKDTNIQKILLTGVADEHIAVQAFNEGIINHYIRKQDIDMVEQLHNAIENAQWRYFNLLSKVAIKAITADKSTISPLVDPSFQSQFRRLMKRNSFKEAYLCESMGSYLFLKEDGACHGLVVNNHEQLELCWESGEARNVDHLLIEQLKNKEKILCYYNREGALEPSPESWENHLYPIQILQGAQETYYYAFAPNIFDIDHSRVMPFAKHKENITFEIQS